MHPEVTTARTMTEAKARRALTEIRHHLIAARDLGRKIVDNVVLPEESVLQKMYQSGGLTPAVDYHSTMHGQDDDGPLYEVLTEVEATLERHGKPLSWHHAELQQIADGFKALRARCQRIADEIDIPGEETCEAMRHEMETCSPAVKLQDAAEFFATTEDDFQSIDLLERYLQETAEGLEQPS